MPNCPRSKPSGGGCSRRLPARASCAVEQRRADLRFAFPPDFAARLAGRRVLDLRRRAKYLLADLESGETLVMHLGMSGSFRIDADAAGAFSPSARQERRA